MLSSICAELLALAATVILSPVCKISLPDSRLIASDVGKGAAVIMLVVVVDLTWLDVTVNKVLPVLLTCAISTTVVYPSGAVYTVLLVVVTLAVTVLNMLIATAMSG